MVIQVTYQTKKDAADRHSHFTHTELFNVTVMPDKATVAKKLLHKNVAQDTISMCENEEQNIAHLKRKGFRVIEL